MTITVTISDNELLSCQEDIEERLFQLEVEHGGEWKYNSTIFKFVGTLNLKDYLLSCGLTLVI